MKLIFLLLSLLLFQTQIYSQEIDQSNYIENWIENNSEQDEEPDLNSLVDDLSILTETPLDLNEATAENLSVFDFLTDFQISNLIKYRHRSGRIISIYELQSIKGFENEDIDRLLPWVVVATEKQKKPLTFRKMWQNKHHELLFRTQWVAEEQAGYMANNKINPKFVGSKFRIYTKYKLNYKQRFKIGFTAEKDPGENLFSDNLKNGFDFQSAYFQAHNFGHIHNLVIGDFECKMGQGLVFSSGLNLGKSTMVMSIRRKIQGLRGYSSTDENSFMRGFGTTLKFGKMLATAFISSKNRDANLLLNKDSLATSFSSFQSTGSHASSAELVDQKSVGEKILGFNLNYEFKNVRIGANYLGYKYALPMNRSIQAYNQFEFNGQTNQNYSIDYFANFNHFQFFGEIAMSENRGKAILNAMTAEVNERFQFSLLHRNYDRDYQAVYGKAFGDGTKNENEKGLFFGFEFLPAPKWAVSAYLDLLQSDWLRYQVSAPSRGYDFSGQISYQLSRNSNLIFKIHKENKAKDFSFDTYVRTENYTKSNYRLTFDFRPLDQISFRNRIEWLELENPFSPRKSGFLIFQDLNYTFSRFPLKLNFHYAIFDTEDWDTRIYAYEQDILYGFSIPAYYMKGTRACMTLKYTLFPKCNLWFRCARTSYENLQTISSGDAQINGSQKTDYKIQLQIKF